MTFRAGWTTQVKAGGKQIRNNPLAWLSSQQLSIHPPSAACPIWLSVIGDAYCLAPSIAHYYQGFPRMCCADDQQGLSTIPRIPFPTLVNCLKERTRKWQEETKRVDCLCEKLNSPPLLNLTLSAVSVRATVVCSDSAVCLWQRFYDNNPSICTGTFHAKMFHLRSRKE